MNAQITQALAEIKQQGLNRIRCVLTGAPYATLEDAEIILALEGDVEANPNVSVDRLVDNWHLRALTLNSHVMPSLRAASAKGLIPLVRKGADGHARILVYLLTRLLVPLNAAERGFDSEKLELRMRFSAKMYDTAIQWPVADLTELAQELIVIDSYCSMPYWHKLHVFGRLSKLGIWAQNQALQRLFSDPLEIAESAMRVKMLVKYMYKCLIHVVETDGSAGYGGNRLSQQVLYVTASEIHIQGLPKHQEKPATQAQLDYQAKMRAVNSTPQARIAWSATFGHGTKMGEIKPSRQKAAPTAKTKPNKPQNDFDKLFHAAFATLSTVPMQFTTVQANPAFAHLMPMTEKKD